MQHETTPIMQYRCKKCNAPYPLGADDVIATCPYCGFTFTVGGEEISHLILPNELDGKLVKKKVMDWFELAAKKTVGRGIIKNIELEESILQWIPTFRITGHFESYYFGYKREASGNSTKYKRLENRESGSLIEWVIARRYAATFGINEFILSLEDTPTQAFKMEMIGAAPVLNSEIIDEDAVNRAQKNRKDRERVELLKKMDKLLDHSLKITPESSEYTHAPYWLARYSYQKGTFRVAVSGATGEVLLGELPVTKRYRVKKWFTSILLLVSASALFQVLPYILIPLLSSNTDAGDIWVIPIVMLIVACGLWVGSVATVGGALKYEIQVTSRGEERTDVSTVEGAMRRLGGRKK